MQITIQHIKSGDTWTDEYPGIQWLLDHWKETGREGVYRIVRNENNLDPLINLIDSYLSLL